MPVPTSSIPQERNFSELKRLCSALRKCINLTFLVEMRQCSIETMIQSSQFYPKYDSLGFVKSINTTFIRAGCATLFTLIYLPSSLSVAAAR